MKSKQTSKQWLGRVKFGKVASIASESVFHIGDLWLDSGNVFFDKSAHELPVESQSCFPSLFVSLFCIFTCLRCFLLFESLLFESCFKLLHKNCFLLVLLCFKLM